MRAMGDKVTARQTLQKAGVPITGVDIVKAMIRAASGELLGIVQSDLRITGHAIEARVYTEDPDQKPSRK